MKSEVSIAKDIYQKLKHDILNISIKEGDILTLTGLSEKYGTSKTPVRDALNELEKEGYLKSLPRKGYLVIPVTQNDIRDYFQMRLILERAAASIAAIYAEQSELEEIMQIAKQFAIGNPGSDFAEFNRHNSVFHMSIIRAAHNSVLLNVSAGILDNLSRILLNDSRFIDLSHEQSEHIAIAQALIERDSAKAERLVIEHITELQKRSFNTQGALYLPT